MHVFGGGSHNVTRINQTPTAVALRLPESALREAQLLCPLEIAVREGDLATELLNFAASTNQDFIVLGSSDFSGASSDGDLVHRIVNEALCPVIILSQAVSVLAQAPDVLAALPRPPQGVRT